jgi:TRAP-type uncharacterized transport system fused permease subunit
MIMTAILLCGVGLIVNVITTAGIGNTFSLMIADLVAGQSADRARADRARLAGARHGPAGHRRLYRARHAVGPALYQLILQSQLADILAAGNCRKPRRRSSCSPSPRRWRRYPRRCLWPRRKRMIAALPLESLSLLYDQAFQPEVLAVALLSAHMIIFWLSQDSNVTPPVCLAAFTGAAIAESPPMKTGFAAGRSPRGSISCRCSSPTRRLGPWRRRSKATGA